MTMAEYNMIMNRKPITRKPKISQDLAQEMLSFLEACLECEDADALHDFVVNNAEDVVDKAYDQKIKKGQWLKIS